MRSEEGELRSEVEVVVGGGRGGRSWSGRGVAFGVSLLGVARWEGACSRDWVRRPPRRVWNVEQSNRWPNAPNRKVRVVRFG